MSAPLKVFITYSHNDLEQNIELKTRLAVMESEGKITLWDDNKILPGDEWEKDISDNLAESDILLYLVSSASLASKNCNKELAEALNFKIRVIPIILEDCDWQNHQLSCFEVLPHKGVPINEWQPESKGWQNVVAGIRKAVDKMQAQMDPSPKVSEKELRAEVAFQQGNVLMMLRQIDGAIERYSYAIELDPDFAEFCYNRGLAYGIKGELDHAIKDFNTAIELNPNYVYAYYDRGVAYGVKGEPDHAIKDFNTAIRLNPKYAKAYNNRGAAYNSKKEYDRAIEDCNKAIQLNPNYFEAYHNRGVAYGEKGAYDRAIQEFTKAIDLNPNYSQAYSNRGVAYGKQGNFGGAIEDFTKAIDLNPDYANAYNNRGLTWLHLREWENARLDLTTAKNMGRDIIATFRNNYENVADFEGRYDVQLPADIAAMLTEQS